MAPSHDHFIARGHMRPWAKLNRVMVFRRDRDKPKPLDIGKAVAAEEGLNSPSVEAAYGKIESAFSRALPVLLDSKTKPGEAEWQAIREYAVLMHDRYSALRGSAQDVHGLFGGNTLMAPNPAHWGHGGEVSDLLASLATTMDREQLKQARLELLPVLAQLLPPLGQVFYGGPMLLGDAGIHAFTLHNDGETSQTVLAMPLAPYAMIAFGNQPLKDEEAREVEHLLRIKIAMESSVVIDTPEAPVINGLVTNMWHAQPRSDGAGVPRAVHVWSRVEDISTTREPSGG